MDIYYGEFPKEAVKDTVSPATQQCDLATEHVKVIDLGHLNALSLFYSSGS